MVTGDESGLVTVLLIDGYLTLRNLSSLDITPISALSYNPYLNWMSHPFICRSTLVPWWWCGCDKGDADADADADDSEGKENYDAGCGDE